MDRLRFLLRVPLIILKLGSYLQSVTYIALQMLLVCSFPPHLTDMFVYTLSQYWVISEKLRWYGIAIKYLSITLLSLLQYFISILKVTAISVPQSINIHIKCLVVRLKVSHRTNLPEVTIYKCILPFTMQVGWHI